MNRKLIQFLVILLLTSCSPTVDDYREEGEGIKRSLVKEFKQIHSRADLIEAKPKLKLLFNNLVTTIIAAQDVKTTHPEFEASIPSPQSQILSDQLRNELNRIYKNIDGARDIMEKCQEDALLRLDSYEKKVTRGH